jgi:predicted DNA-binding transcriptional regulator AlpA
VINVPKDQGDMENKLRAEAAARYVGLKRSTLAKMRVRGDGPPYSKAGARVVVYDVRDLEAWLHSTRRTSTRPVNTSAQV